MEKWQGKISVVTGGSDGIGRAIANKLLATGLTVTILDVNPINDDRFHFIKCDVSDLISVKNAFETIEKKYKFIHVLINNAGVLKGGNVLDPSDATTENIQKVIETNFFGPINASREGYQLMKKSNDYGLIINICSNYGHNIMFPNIFSVYPATKYGVRAFSEILRQELIVNGNGKVRVSNLSPGAVNTNLLTNSGLNLQPAENLVKPEDVADAVLYILSTPYNVNITELTIKSSADKC